MKRKVKIEALPKARTGQQVGYGLYNRLATMGGLSDTRPSNDLGVSRTIGAVPREDATIEAEGGETVFGDIAGIGIPQHYTITGPRHAQGGVPMALDGGEFIFSDYHNMKLKDPEALSYFGKTAKKGGKGKGFTYADIAKQYDINKYLKILKDPNSDDIDKKTAERMIENFNLKLGALGLHQEAQKGFEQGVPEVSRPYMEKMNITEEDLGIVPQEEMSPEMMLCGGKVPRRLKRQMGGPGAEMMGQEQMMDPSMMGQPGIEQQQDPMAQIMPMIEQMMSQGADPNQIAVELLGMGVEPEMIMEVFMQMGMPEGEAQMAIEAAMSEMQQPEMMDPAMMEGQGMSPDMMPEMDPTMGMMQMGGAPQMGMQQEPSLEDMIAQALQEGASPEEVLQALVQNGVPEQEAQQAVSNVAQQIQAPQQQMMQRGGFQLIDLNIFKNKYSKGGQIKRYEYYGNRLKKLEKMYNDAGGKLSVPQKMKMNTELQSIFKEYDKEFGLPPGAKGNYGMDVNKAMTMARSLGDDITTRYNKELGQQKAKSPEQSQTTAQTATQTQVPAATQTNVVTPAANTNTATQNVNIAGQTPTKASANPTFPKQTKVGNYYGKVNKELFDETVARNQWFDWTDFDPSNSEDVKRFQREYNELVDKYNLDADKVTVDGKIGEQTQSINVGYDPDKEDKIDEIDNVDNINNVKKQIVDSNRSDVVDPNIQEYRDPVEADWTTPDIVNFRGAISDRLGAKTYYPHAQMHSPQFADPTFYDVSRTAAGIGEQSNIAGQALGQFTGPQALSARMASIQGQGAKAMADAIGNYDDRNVGIANQFASQDAQIANQAQLQNLDRMKRFYDEGTIAQQQRDNTKRQLDSNIRQGFAQGSRNASDIALMNATSEQFNIDPLTGRVVFTGVDKPIDNSQLAKDYDAKLREYMETLGDPKAAVQAANNWQRTQAGKPSFAQKGGYVMGANVFPFMFY